MSEVSKFISIEEMDKNVEASSQGGCTQGVGAGNSTFKVCGTNKNLPAKQPSFWAKLKSALSYEIKVELTPYEQKVEKEINDFLHQEITWQGFKNFLFQDISFGKKA